MPEYQTPGVYVQEVPSGVRSIAGADRTAAAFIGPTRRGPAVGEAVTGLRSFARVYGGLGERGAQGPDYVAQAARAFFANGGKRLHVLRSEGVADEPGVEAALAALDGLPEVATVAAPGSTAGYAGAGPEAQRTIVRVQQRLIDRCEDAGYLFAVLDSPDLAGVRDVLDYRNLFDSSHAALYYPWVTVAHPKGAGTATVPPSGFIAGVIAGTDRDRGIFTAPANVALSGAAGFERDITQADQDILNPAGVNCLRSFPGRGPVVWGARTLSSDPEWKYVNVRRYVSYLEASIDEGTRWAVFEPNDAPLWSALRSSIETFLYGEWRAGGLMGGTPDEAYFVRCDRTTMTQQDIDEGRCICLIGVAPTKPAEFVIFRISQQTLAPGP